MTDDIQFQDNSGALLIGAYLHYRDDHDPSKEEFEEWASQHEVPLSRGQYNWIQDQLADDDLNREWARTVFQEWLART